MTESPQSLRNSLRTSRATGSSSTTRAGRASAPTKLSKRVALLQDALADDLMRSFARSFANPDSVSFRVQELEEPPAPRHRAYSDVSSDETQSPLHLDLQPVKGLPWRPRKRLFAPPRIPSSLNFAWFQSFQNQAKLSEDGIGRSEEPFPRAPR